MSPVLAVENLTIELALPEGRRRIVEDLCFAAEAGTMLALVGESGSGKSLTALCLLGLLPSCARVRGAAYFRAAADTAPVELLHAGERALARRRGRQIAWVPQESLAALDPRQTVATQMCQALQATRAWPPGEARRQSLALLAALDLADPARCLASYPFQISGGERQRVLLAMALLPRPRLLLADEPTTALDLRAQATALAQLRSAQRLTGMATLFITHDLALAAQWANQIAVLHRGRLVELGPAARLLAAPSEPYTRSLLAALPLLPPRRQIAKAP